MRHQRIHVSRILRVEADADAGGQRNRLALEFNRLANHGQQHPRERRNFHLAADVVQERIELVTPNPSDGITFLRHRRMRFPIVRRTASPAACP
jgi:hypothetical protein